MIRSNPAAVLLIVVSMLTASCASTKPIQSTLHRPLPFPPDKIFLLADVGLTVRTEVADRALDGLEQAFGRRGVDTERYTVTDLEVDRTAPVKRIKTYEPDYVLLLVAQPGGPENVYTGGKVDVKLLDASDALYWDMTLYARLHFGEAGKGRLAARISDTIIRRMEADGVFSSYNKEGFL